MWTAVAPAERVREETHGFKIFVIFSCYCQYTNDDMKVKLTVWSIGDHLTPGGCGTCPPLSVDDLQKDQDQISRSASKHSHDTKFDHLDTVSQNNAI